MSIGFRSLLCHHSQFSRRVYNCKYLDKQRLACLNTEIGHFHLDPPNSYLKSRKPLFNSKQKKKRNKLVSHRFNKSAVEEKLQQGGILAKVNKNQMETIKDKITLLKNINKALFPEKSFDDIDFENLKSKLQELAILCEELNQIEKTKNMSKEINNMQKFQKPSNDEQAVVSKSETWSGEEFGFSNFDVVVDPPKIKIKKPARFEFSNYRTRYVAMHILYIGWDYHGFASQDIQTTIENIFLKALKATRLIPKDYDGNKDIMYSRCGRTDKGVSALSQVVSLMVRSRAKKEDEELSADDEYDYSTMLNAILPNDIRVWGWSPVNLEFHARFKATYREYKYFILDEMPGKLDMNLVENGARRLIGRHDFRNFCKMNLQQTSHHIRDVQQVSLMPYDRASFPETKVYVLTIRSRAFLWHQVRCIVAVLLLIGQGMESPDIIDNFLDINKTPAKPLYKIASEYPLVLWDCGFEDLRLRRPSEQISTAIKKLTDMRNSHVLGVCLIDNMIEGIKEVVTDNSKTEIVEGKGKTNKKRQACGYVKLMDRPQEPSLEERLEFEKTKSTT